MANLRRWERQWWIYAVYSVCCLRDCKCVCSCFGIKVYISKYKFVWVILSCCFFWKTVILISEVLKTLCYGLFHLPAVSCFVSLVPLFHQSLSSLCFAFVWYKNGTSKSQNHKTMHFCRVWHLELSRGGCNLLKRTLQRDWIWEYKGVILYLWNYPVWMHPSQMHFLCVMFQCKAHGIAHRVLSLQKILSVQRFYPP